MSYSKLKYTIYVELSCAEKREILMLAGCTLDNAIDIANGTITDFWNELEKRNAISDNCVKLYLWRGQRSNYNQLLNFYGKEHCIFEETNKLTFKEELRQFIIPIATLSETSFSLFYDRLQALGAESINDLKLLTEQDVIGLQILKLLQARKFIAAVKNLV